MRAQEKRTRLLQTQKGRSSVPERLLPTLSTLWESDVTRWHEAERREGTGLPWGPQGALVGAATAEQ